MSNRISFSFSALVVSADTAMTDEVAASLSAIKTIQLDHVKHDLAISLSGLYRDTGHDLVVLVGFSEVVLQDYLDELEFEVGHVPPIILICEQASPSLLESNEADNVEVITQAEVRSQLFPRLVSYFVASQRDVSEREHYQARLTYTLSHDVLTGLPNRFLLESKVELAIRSIIRQGGQFAVVMVDLDGFKSINDSLGHAFGDRVLIESSARLLNLTGHGETLSRLGADQFVALLTAQDESAVVRTVEQMLQVLTLPFANNGHEAHLTASAGITYGRDDDSTAEALLQQAELAVGMAKRTGHNTWRHYTPDLHQYIDRQLQLRNELQHAIQNGEFLLHYQPLVDSQTGRIIGLEALIRWAHPQQGLILPNDFISLAEETGQIVPMGQWVLDQACAFNQTLIRRGLLQVPINVNISVVQFLRENFVEQVMAALQRHQLPPQLLELDLTESVVFDVSEAVIARLRQLRAHGVRISVDDFGTGSTSLNYLKYLPINTLKIDRSFIESVISNRHDAAITSSLITLGNNLDLTVVAEGVETRAQLDFLVKHHCRHYQGYLITEPLPEEALISFVQIYQQSARLRAAQGDVDQQPALLLVDDEPNILMTLRRTLRSEGYRIMTASGAEEAYQILASHPVDVIVSDQRMPGQTGTQFLSQVKGIYPNTVRLILSGYTDLKTVTDAVNEGAVYKFLTKPWSGEELKEVIRKAFDKARQNRAGEREGCSSRS